MTNRHVLESIVAARNSIVEFSYEYDVAGRMKSSVSFKLSPDEFFFNDKHLDYAVVAVEQVNADGAPLRRQGWNPLIPEQGKAISAQWVNIIQHPGGGPKQLVLRENQIVDVYPDASPEFLSYRADTEAGSSGSPVFNDRWEVVALHHAGVYKQDSAGRPLTKDKHVWNSSMGEDALAWEANEGIRITKIIEHLSAREMTAAERTLLTEAFSAAPAISDDAGFNSVEVSNNPPAIMNSNNNRSVSIILPSEPCEITVRFGAAGSNATIQPPAGVTAPLAGATPQLTYSPGTPSEEALLAAAKAEFAKYSGVLGVRLGYKYVNDWITKERAVVVIVRQRLSQNELASTGRDALPRDFRGLPVQIENAGITDLLAEHLPSRTSINPTESLRAGLANLALESRYTKPALVST